MWWAQILMVVFSILYGIISWRFRYWGEMMTYLEYDPAHGGVVYHYLTKKSFGDKRQRSGDPAVESMSRFRSVCFRHHCNRYFCYFFVGFKNPNLLFSTISITPALWAAAPDHAAFIQLCGGSMLPMTLLLIVLWSLAAMENPAYIPVIVNFVIFFFNDMYGFIGWRRREAVQGLTC